MGSGEAGRRYSCSELARMLGVCQATVSRWVKRGWLKGAETTNRGYLIRRRAVRRLLVDHPGAASTIMEARRRYWARVAGQATVAGPADEVPRRTTIAR